MLPFSIVPKMPPDTLSRRRGRIRGGSSLAFILIVLLAAALILNGANPGNAQTLYTFVTPPTVSASALVHDAGGSFYGTTVGGGANARGTVFRLTKTGVTDLHDFAGNDGANPCAALVRGPGGDFYGTTRAGGANNTGTIFQISRTGVFTKLYDFSARTCPTMNADGMSPKAPLVFASDGNLYGTTSFGGVNSAGTIFKFSITTGFTLLHTFSEVGSSGENADGACPVSGLTQGADGSLYGTALRGPNGDGVAFKITTDGTFTLLHNFDDIDGANPAAGLTLGPDCNFYGTTQAGGRPSNTAPFGNGTVFQMTPAGEVTTLAYLDGANGDVPLAPLVVGPDGALYGTTSTDGPEGYGTVFRLNTDGSGFETVHAFSLLNASGYNSDGAFPTTGLTLAPDGRLYGSTSFGGTHGTGTLYDLNPPASGKTAKLKTRWSFAALADSSIAAVGSNPVDSPVIGPDGSLYGTTMGGGTGQAGTVFRLTPDPSSPTGYTESTLYSFSRPHGSHVNGDGASPMAALVFVNGDLYGTTRYGGAAGTGTVFKITTDGALTTLHDFPALGTSGDNAEGAQPCAGLAVGPDGALYGTCTVGGATGDGTIFKITTDGTFTLLHSLAWAEGAYPRAALTLGSDQSLYGTASRGGTHGSGALFHISSTGAFATFYSFSGAIVSVPPPPHPINPDGMEPNSSLVEVASGLFAGTAVGGGPLGYGDIFQVRSDGSAFLVEHAFNGTTDGGNPNATLTLIPSASPVTVPDSMTGGVYHKLGLCMTGGVYQKANSASGTACPASSGNGTIYVEDSSGVFRTASMFGGGSILNGADPISGVVPGADGYYYGTTPAGGMTLSGMPVAGTVFRAAVPYIDAVTVTPPASGTLSTVTIVGSGFVAGSTVSVNGAAVAATTTPHQITFTAFLGTAATDTFVVTAPDGTQSNTATYSPGS